MADTVFLRTFVDDARAAGYAACAVSRGGQVLGIAYAPDAYRWRVFVRVADESMLDEIDRAYAGARTSPR